LLVNDSLDFFLVNLARADFHFSKHGLSAVGGSRLKVLFDGGDVLLDLGAPVAAFDDKLLGATLEALDLGA
jgi:hypothetical protein